jgi:hypothetical protein
MTMIGGGSILALLALLAPLGHRADAAFIAAPQAQATASEPTSPYALLKPESFATPLGADAAWAAQNIPLFESANSTLDLVYYFRWRTYRSHIHPTNDSDIPFVVTEFAPNVPWAGKYNTINCAAGHHLREGGWLRQPSYYMDSYTRWWVDKAARHNYFYWYASALQTSYERSGNASLPLLRDVVPAYMISGAVNVEGPKT